MIASSVFLASCGSAPKATGPALDTELAQSLASARSAYNQGAYSQAAALYQRALRRAEVMDDPAQIANAAYDYAATLIQAGKIDEAAAALDEAAAESRRAKLPALDVLLLQSRVARQQHRRDDAIRYANDVLAHQAGDGEKAVRLQATLAIGAAAIDAAAGPPDVGLARTSLAQARAMVPAQGVAPSIASGLAELEGEIAAAESNWAGAAAAFDRAAEFARQARLYADMRRGLDAAAGAYRSAGDRGAAADRQFRAARSAAADNDPSARAMFGRAMEDAKAVGDEGLIARVNGAAKQLPATRPAR